MATENTRFKMSEARLEELKKRLEFLQTERTAEVAEQLKEARSYGDLSENSEYDEAKTEQGKVYSEIAEIKNLIENAEIVQETNMTDQVGIGTRVRSKNIRRLASGQSSHGRDSRADYRGRSPCRYS